MESLKGKNCLVIGGGSGMGAATALLLAEKGSSVAISGRREKNLREVASRNASGNPLLTRPADVTERESLERLFDWFDQELGQLDVLVDAAGVNVPRRSIEELSEDDWDTVIRINLTGAFDCMRLALQRMRPRKDGLIVMINSVSGKRSTPLGGAAYNASKFGLTGLASCVAEEERENGIRITNVFPGEVNTPILDQRPVPPPAEHRARILQPEDVANTVLLLAELPARAHVPELIIKPTSQGYV